MTDKLNFKEMSRENKLILQKEQLKWIQQQIAYPWKSHALYSFLIYITLFLVVLLSAKSVDLFAMLLFLPVAHVLSSLLCNDERTGKLAAVVEVLVEHNYDLDNTLNKLRKKI